MGSVIIVICVLVLLLQVATRGPMDSFGEKALLYYCPRAATVQATSDGLLWAVDRVTFRHMIAHASEDNIAATVNALRSVPILSSLSDEQLSKVAAAVKVILAGGVGCGDFDVVLIGGGISCHSSRNITRVKLSSERVTMETLSSWSRQGVLQFQALPLASSIGSQM